MLTRTKNCPTCEGEFSYPIGSGNDRKFCSPKCRESAKLSYRLERARLAGKCSMSWCERKATRKRSDLCDACYCRKRRGEDISAPPQRDFAYRYKTKAGYIKLLLPEHPLAEGGGHVAEHRVVAYKRYGPGMQACYWCNRSTSWADVVIDHLDETKDNNAPDNLVVACNTCNRSRGAMLPFIQGMRPEAMATFVTCVAQQCGLSRSKTRRGE